MTAHSLLEIRTDRQAEETPETMVQLLSTLPKLNNNLYYKLINKDEKVSFELVVENQTIYFLVFVPKRLEEYLKGAIAASYPTAIISLRKIDPLVEFKKQAKNIRAGSLSLKNQDYLPLKTYADFKDVDPLTTLLSTLSKNHPEDKIIIQFSLKNDGETWKNAGWSVIGQASSNQLVASDDKIVAKSHPQKSLIEKKLNSQALRIAIKIAIDSNSKERSKLLLETIAATFNSITQSEGNSLILKKRYLRSGKFLTRMQQRSFLGNKKIHLSLDEIATFYHFPNDKLSGISNIAWGKNLLGDPPENLPVITKETDKEIKHNINVFAETNFKNSSVKYGLKRADRRRHMYVIGKTGTGKSTLLANMAINDLKNDEGMCVVDPHGDLVETILDYIPSRRINDVIYFNPADPDKTVQLNLFEGESVVHRELIASGIISIFQKLYGYSWGPRLEYILRNSLLTLLKSPEARLSDVLDLLTNKRFRDKVVENLDDPILKSFWVDEYNKMQERQRTESIASILNKVGQFVTSPLVRNVVNAQKSSFSIEKAMDDGKIILANLSQGKLGEDNATLLGAMLITKIQLAAMSRVHTDEENRRDFYLYVDEFQNFATDSFNKILSEARKYRLNLTLANQYIAQIPEEVQKAIFGNCGSMISFVMGADDAEVFAKEYGDLYTREDLVSLGRYQIINKVSIDNIISKPFVAQTLSLAKSHNLNKEKVIKVSRERYSRDRS
jgi:DNA helicase HerA-like ATPase